MKIFGYDTADQWDFENGYYLTSHVKRLSKAIAHYELYKRITHLPGQIIECGVYKGASLIRLLTYRDMLEGSYSRKIIGFDVFGKFPEQGDDNDLEFIQRFEGSGGEGIKREDLIACLKYKGFCNFELVQGDIAETIPRYLQDHPELKISLLHLDVDVYRPSVIVLEHLYDNVVKGGLIVLDDYATVAGETRAVDEFLTDKSVIIEKLPISHIPAFIVKP